MHRESLAFKKEYAEAVIEEKNDSGFQRFFLSVICKRSKKMNSERTFNSNPNSKN